jgi:hypothetical protein
MEANVQATQERQLTAEDLLDLEPATREYAIPGKGIVVIHGLTNQDLAKCRLQSRHKGDVDEGEFRARVVQKAVHNQNGKRLMDITHIAKLLVWPAAVIIPIYEIAAELSGLGEKAAETIEKNSETPDQPEAEDAS